ncbi:MAG: DUF2505 family protein [Myxococcales bacterium]|jgi:hypothetical protein
MDFEIVHTFDADRETVERAMLDPQLAPYLLEHMTLVRHIELLEHRDDGAAIVRRVRYVPEPVISRIGTMQVRPEWMSWTEESRFDLHVHRVDYENVPHVPKIAEVMEQRGVIRFEEAGPGKCRRTVCGSLKIKMPLVGRIVEKVIYPNALKILDEEARLVNAWLAQRR